MLLHVRFIKLGRLGAKTSGAKKHRLLGPQPVLMHAVYGPPQLPCKPVLWKRRRRTLGAARFISFTGFDVGTLTGKRAKGSGTRVQSPGPGAMTTCQHGPAN